jgi:hypothetical protein
VRHPGSNSYPISNPGWKLLGGLELTVGPDIDRTVGKWLAVILSALNLRADFLNKVLKSAQEAVVRTMQSKAVTQFQHVHLLVFATVDQAPKRQAWGFFRIEKTSDSPNRNDSNDHSIEFYLYLEE